MPKKTLTKKQIRKATAVDLLLRIDALHVLSGRRPQDAGVPMADIYEASAIDEELRLRLYKVLAPY